MSFEIALLAVLSGVLVMAWATSLVRVLHSKKTPVHVLPAVNRVLESHERLLVIDIETGGLDPNKSALLQVALVRVTNGQETERFQWDILPEPGLNVDPEAAAISGWTGPSAKGVSEQQFLREILEILPAKPRVWLGHRVDFDLAFLAAAAQRHQYPAALFDPRYKIDTATLARSLGISDKMDDLIARYGLPARAQHSACEDALLSYSIYRKLLLEFLRAA